MRLDRWFKTHFPDLAFGHLQKLLRSGQVRVDGGRVKTSTGSSRAGGAHSAAGGDRSLPRGAARLPGTMRAAERPVGGVPQDGASMAPAKSPAKIANDAEALRAMILYEDDQVFVFNKPAGLAVQGGSGLTRHVDGMLEAFRDRKGQKPRLVHRLDRDTSGVLVVARTRLAAQKLAEAFRARATRKIYWALVKGVPKPHQGRISTWLAKEGTPDGDRMRVARHGADDASHAVSLYSVVEQAGNQLAWLSMRPVTGPHPPAQGARRPYRPSDRRRPEILQR